MSGTRLLLICAVGQLTLVPLVPSPWWVPDLVLIALVLAVTATPSRWLLYGMLAGWINGLWVVQRPWASPVAALALAAIVRVGMRHADLTDPRLQRLLVGGAVLLTRGWLVWLQQVWSLPVVVGLLLQSGLTILALPLVVRRLSRPLTE